MNTYERKAYERELRRVIMTITDADLSEWKVREQIQEVLFGLLGLIAEDREA